MQDEIMSTMPTIPTVNASVKPHEKSALEKPTFDHDEESVRGEEKLEAAIEAFEVDPHLDRKVVFKLDILLMPVMCIIFIFLFLDRANIGNARVAGFQKSLHLTDLQYQTGMFSFASSFADLATDRIH